MKDQVEIALTQFANRISNHPLTMNFSGGTLHILQEEMKKQGIETEVEMVNRQIQVKIK